MPKKAAAAEFNMAEAIREVFKENPKASSNEAAEAIAKKYPSVTINKNSFGVAFYTNRKKLGIGGSKKRGRKFTKRAGRPVAAAKTTSTVDLAMIQTTAKFLNQVGGAEAALEAIKFVQAAQVK